MGVVYLRQIQCDLIIKNGDLKNTVLSVFLRVRMNDDLLAEKMAENIKFNFIKGTYMEFNGN